MTTRRWRITGRLFTGRLFRRLPPTNISHSSHSSSLQFVCMSVSLCNMVSFLLVLEKLCVFPLLSYYCHTHNTSVITYVWDFPHKQFSGIPAGYHVCMQSCVWLIATLWAVARQAALSLGFSRQEYWSGLLFPPPGDLPDAGIEPESLPSSALAGGSLTTSDTWEGH